MDDNKVKVDITWPRIIVSDKVPNDTIYILNPEEVFASIPPTKEWERLKSVAIIKNIKR